MLFLQSHHFAQQGLIACLLPIKLSSSINAISIPARFIPSSSVITC